MTNLGGHDETTDVSERHSGGLNTTKTGQKEKEAAFNCLLPLRSLI
jgi:hypothetical protein